MSDLQKKWKKAKMCAIEQKLKKKTNWKKKTDKKVQIEKEKKILKKETKVQIEKG